MSFFLFFFYFFWCNHSGNIWKIWEHLIFFFLQFFQSPFFSSFFYFFFLFSFSFFSPSSIFIHRLRMIRKGMSLISINGVNSEEMTLEQVQETIQDERKEDDVTCIFKAAPSRSLTPEGKIKPPHMTADALLERDMEQKQNLSSTVVFGEGPLGLELVGRKPRSESIQVRVARKQKLAADRKAKEAMRVEVSNFFFSFVFFSFFSFVFFSCFFSFFSPQFFFSSIFFSHIS